MDVLIVDDDDALLRSLERAVRLLGHSARTASGGEQACARAAERCPELAIVDLIMPGIDGIETIARLHRLCPGCRFVILTGTPQEAAGRTEIMVRPKPLGLAELRDLLGCSALHPQADRAPADRPSPQAP